MKEAVQLSWQSFEQSYVRGPPREVVLPGEARLRLFVADAGTTFGLRVGLGANQALPSSPLGSVQIREVMLGGEATAEIRCVPGAVSKEFFYFLLAVADGMQLKGLSLPDAFDEAVRSWRGLLQGVSRMSDEQELGLFGELLTLALLVRRLGAAAIGCWTGPSKDPHDFRVRRNEFEVKTTASVNRVHVIHGMGQLVPSQKNRLYICSWQLERTGPGSGDTLSERIALTRTSLRANAGSLSRFEELLRKGTGWRDADAALYPVRWRPRTSPTLVAVNTACPRITIGVLSPRVSPALAARISDVSYRVNLDGLGVALQSKTFERILFKGEL
jgi:hypothetical protein